MNSSSSDKWTGASAADKSAVGESEARCCLGFIGTGVMGRSMAGHLLAAGHRLCVHTRTPQRARELLDRGATWADSPQELAACASIIFTMVGFPEDVEEVYWGPQGLFQKVQPGSLLIDLTTSTPALARRLAAEAELRGAEALDAPVSGGDRGAREALLSIMVGAHPGTFARALPFLRLFGTNIRLQGPPGSGQHTKMCNQIAIASGMVGVCEALAYAIRAGLDPETVLASISGGAAGSWSLSNLAPRILKGDFAPGFYVKHFIKDMRIAQTSARQMGLPTPGLDQVLALYEELAAQGYENLGTQALFKLFGEPAAS